jgi:hypothetical protein
MPIGKIIKEGAKLVKRGRKSKRGRPKKKVEVKKKQVVKRTDPNKITRLKGESDAAFKKRKAAIRKEVRESARETVADIPEHFMKELRGYTRKITKEELEELARMGITARKEGSKVGKKSKDKKKDKFHKKGIPFPTPKGINKTIDTLLNPIKAKTGGVVKRKTGGPIGVGKALRGYGKGYK